MRPATIMVVDDHAMVRVGLKAILAKFPQFQIVAEAADADQAIERACIHRPDLILMDLNLPGKSGIAAMRTIHAELPSIYIILLTGYILDDDQLMEAVEAGASGYVLKATPLSELIEALEAGARGDARLNPEAMNRVFSHLHRSQRADRGQMFGILSDQQLRAARYVGMGYLNPEIAAKLGVSEKTVRNMISTVLGKLGLRTRQDLASAALSHGIARRHTERIEKRL